MENMLLSKATSFTGSFAFSSRGEEVQFYVIHITGKVEWGDPGKITLKVTSLPLPINHTDTMLCYLEYKGDIFTVIPIVTSPTATAF